MDSFLWGVEYESNLLIYDQAAVDRDTIWARDKTQLTTEYWDLVLGHKPYARDDRYWVTGVPLSDEDSLQSKVYNLEAQMGVFKGKSALKDFDANVALLDHKLTNILAKKRVKTPTGNKALFGYTEYHEDEANVPELFLDKDATKKGVYATKHEGVYAGYRTEMFGYDLTGKPQLTATIRLDYVLRLFELVYNHSEDYYEQVATSLDLSRQYMDLLPLDVMSARERNEMHGFVVYLLHYFEQYKRYVLYLDEHGGEQGTTYFKSFFFIKPRTNPASLYTKLSRNQHVFLGRLQTALTHIEPTEYTEYLIRVLSKVDNKDCVYAKNIRGVPNGLYRYDMDDLDTYLGFMEHKKQIEVGVPCVDDFHEIPVLSYYGENDFDVKGTHSLWEWKTTTRAVAYEFRDMMEMVAISLSILREEDNEYYYQFFKADMITPSQLKEMVHLLMRGFFTELFSKRRVSRKKCPDGQVWDKTDKRCREPKRRVSRKKCPDGQVWDKTDKRCRESKRCKKGERRDKSMKRCVPTNYK